jgi:hypothetical protein
VGTPPNSALRHHLAFAHVQVFPKNDDLLVFH